MITWKRISRCSIGKWILHSYPTCSPKSGFGRCFPRWKWPLEFHVRFQWTIFSDISKNHQSTPKFCGSSSSSPLRDAIVLIRIWGTFYGRTKPMRRLQKMEVPEKLQKWVWVEFSSVQWIVAGNGLKNTAKGDASMISNQENVWIYPKNRTMRIITIVGGKRNTCFFVSTDIYNIHNIISNIYTI